MYKDTVYLPANIKPGIYFISKKFAEAQFFEKKMTSGLALIRRSYNKSIMIDYYGKDNDFFILKEALFFDKIKLP